jgi:hypothetical protein
MISTRHITPRETNTSTERPYRPLLVIRPQDLRDHPLPEDTAIGLALRLGTQDTPGSREALHQLITGESPFLLLLDTPDDSLFETIALSMFSRHYIRMEDMPVLAGDVAPPATLIHKLQAQGWPEIRQWNTRHAHWLTSQHQVDELADTLLTVPEQPYIFVEGHTPDETIALEEALHHHCTALLQDNPPLQALMKEKHQLQKKLDTLQNEHRVLQERMHNAGTTIDIIRNKYKDDYDTLFSWYQQEYEALPLWYKRFGQLIKVLTGKRTAKSLVLAIRRRLHRHTAPRNPNSHQKKDRT